MCTQLVTAQGRGTYVQHHSRTCRSLAAQMDSLCSAWQWSPQDTILHPLPLHHIHGIVNALYCPLLVGAHVEFMSKFSVAAVWDRLMVSLTQL